MLFDDMTLEEIFSYLYKRIKIKSFNEYLKKYIYDCAEIQEDFPSVKDRVYRNIIKDAFAENGMPVSLTDTVKTKSEIINTWLSQGDVRRELMFHLGFGLRMSDEDVSLFLVDIMGEDDFYRYDKDEVIYWYCFKNQFEHLQALELQRKYEEELPIALDDKYYVTDFKDICQKGDSLELREKRLLAYLSWLKASCIDEKRQRKVADSFEAIEWTARNVYKMTIPKEISQKRTMENMTSRFIQNQFHQHYMTNNRAEDILNKKIKADRYDLISMNFYLWAVKETEKPEDRLKEYMKSTNAILKGCDMGELNINNSYEAYVMLCLLMENPLEEY